VLTNILHHIHTDHTDHQGVPDLFLLPLSNSLVLVGMTVQRTGYTVRTEVDHTCFQSVDNLIDICDHLTLGNTGNYPQSQVAGNEIDICYHSGADFDHSFLVVHKRPRNYSHCIWAEVLDYIPYVVLLFALKEAEKDHDHFLV